MRLFPVKSSATYQLHNRSDGALNVDAVIAVHGYKACLAADYREVDKGTCAGKDPYGSDGTAKTLGAAPKLTIVVHNGSEVF